MPASSELEYWNGSAWVKESNLISLSIKDKLQEPLVLEAMIGNFSDTELNTRESNYGKFLKVRVKEKYSEKYIFYGKVVKTQPDRDGTWGHIVNILAIDNLRELANLRLDKDISGQTSRSGLISNIISNNVWSTSGVPNIAINDATKFKTSTSSETSGVLNKTFRGDRKPILDIMQEVSREDPNGNFFGYDFYLDTEFNGNTPTPDLFYFPRGGIPAGGLPASGLTIEFEGTESNQVLPMMGDYHFPRQSSELITRVKLRWVDTEDKPRKTDCILINHGATSGGNFAIGNTITWTGGGSAKVLLVGANNRWLVLGPDTVDEDDEESNSNWLVPISGASISGSGHSATVNASSANPPGSLRESIEQEAEVVSQQYDISSEKAAAVHAASILYQGGDLIIRGRVKVLKYPQYKITGTHSGSSNSSTLTDSSKTFTNLGIFKTDVVKNNSDGSQATITSVGGNTLVGSLSGGTQNDWDNGDLYEVSVPIRAGHQIYIKDIPTSSGIANQACLVTSIEYMEGPGIQLADIRVLVASDGRGTIPSMPAKQIVKATENASSVPSNDQSGVKPRSILNWTTSILFSPDGTNKHNTIDWTAGSIYFFDGTTYSGIASGTTGAVSAVTYIYFSKATPTALQTTTDASVAQGTDNIVLVTCENVASGGTATIETTTGVAQKNYYSLDTLFDGAAYGRIAIGNLLSNNLNLGSGSLAGVLSLDKTADSSSGDGRKAVTTNEKDGGGRAFAGLNSNGYLTRAHILNDVGLSFVSNSGSSYVGITGAGIIGIGGGADQFQIQATNGVAGFGGRVGNQSTGDYLITADSSGLTLGTGTTGGGSSQGMLNFKGEDSAYGEYKITNYNGVLQLFPGQYQMLRPNNQGGWKLGDETFYWGNIYGLIYNARKTGGTGFSTLKSNTNGDLLWNSSNLASLYGGSSSNADSLHTHSGGGVQLGDNNTWTGANIFNGAYSTFNNTVNVDGSGTFLDVDNGAILNCTSDAAQFQQGVYFKEISSVGTPSSTWGRLYAKSGDSHLYYKNDGGFDIKVSYNPSVDLNSLTTTTNDAIADYYVVISNSSNIAYKIDVADITRLGGSGSGASLSANNTWTGTNTFNGTVNLAYATSSTAGFTQTGGSAFTGTFTATTAAFKLTGLNASTTSTHYVAIQTDGTLIKKNPSSEKYKKNIRDLELDSSQIYNLVPKTFEYKSDDITGFGYIAESVDSVLPSIVMRGNDGTPESIDYPLMNILLVEEIKKLKARIEALEGV